MSKKEFDLETRIFERADKMGLLLSDRLTFFMDLECACAEFNIDRKKLLEFDYLNFVHDVCGIQRHIDRKKSSIGYGNNPTIGVFTNCFVPRCAVQ